MRLPGRAPLASFVVVGPTTTLLCRRWTNDDIQIAARRGFGLGIALIGVKSELEIVSTRITGQGTPFYSL